MAQNQTDPPYEFYRKLSDAVPPLEALFQKLDQSPENPRLHFELGEAAYQAGLLPLSVACFSTVTKLAPRVEAGFFNLGNAFFDLKQFDSATRAYEHAFHLQPEMGTLNNLGNAYASMQDWPNAIHAFQRALNFPDASPTHMRATRTNLGKALLAAKDWDGAIENYRHLILCFPNEIQHLASQAYCHLQKFEFGRAIACLVDALAVSPNAPELLYQIADVNFCRGQTYESLLCMNQAFSILTPPLKLQSRRLQMLAFFEHATPDRILAETSDWANSIVPPRENAVRELSPMPAHPRASPADQPLPVGILCDALPDRGIGDWLPDCLEKCDKAKFQWTLFCDTSLSAQRTAKLLQAGCRLEKTSHLSDDELSHIIKNHRIAMLIDMIGHGLSTRLPVIARKSAPIQTTWGAFPITSGLTQMDFIWSDSIAIPNDSEKNFCEQVIRFPSSCFCFKPSHTIELQTKPPISQTSFRCGFLGHPEHLSDPLITTFQAILAAIPDAEIVFVGLAYRDPSFQSEIRKRLAIHPDLPSPIRFESYQSTEDELNAYQSLDVTLDPLLVSLPQRSFESLWMGVPVVTLLNERLSARSTASILNALSRREWIATSQDETVQAVQSLSACRDVWRSQRAMLRDELLNSPMCDAALIARTIEALIDESIRPSPFATNP